MDNINDIGSDFCELTCSDEGDIQVFTDASDTGFGAHLTLGSEEEPGTSSHFELVGTWCASERLKLDKHVSQKVLDSGVDRSSSLYPQMCKLLLASKSDHTNESYFYAFKRWELFISKHGFCSLPAQPIHVALYLTHLLDQGSTANVINNVVYGIKWAHELNGLSDPTKNSYVPSLVEASKRITGTKRSRKDP
ncbi:hypothetical protein KUTeg_015471 [Tegillarca granosa]|uniref:Uncharacterized protein n=1 Tax=Tegillarca granosa TaxID=220873 RepID=A0ABQ9EQ62_TEGGR|nr:hypothetical protein KUTeg_015471 [Tegillarca granosa]